MMVVDSGRDLSRRRVGIKLPHRIVPSLANTVVFVFAWLAGAACAVGFIGLRVLNPVNTSWFYGDPTTAYLGWAFFRQEPHLRFPIGWATAIAYPFGAPIAYFDSIPLIAALCWAVRDLLPQQFQYFGLYFLLCSVLQFYFGYRISRGVCRGQKVAGVIGGVFFLFAPPFLYRAAGHFALASHWLLLAALDQLLSASKPLTWLRVGWPVILCFVAGAINPYIALMTLMICAAAQIRSMLLQQGSVRRCVTGIVGAAGSAALSLLLFGFLRGTHLSQYAASGFDFYSMNLLSPIDPHLGPAYGLLLASQVTGPGQYEGYNYLGLGMLLLGLISLARRPSVLAGIFRRGYIPVLAICLLCTLIALSTKATLGRYVLYKLSLPAPMMVALSAFHGSGRFFWPAYYVIFAGIIGAAYRAFSRLVLYPILAFALAIQIADLLPLRWIHAQWQTATFPSVSSDPSWHVLGKYQGHLVVIPPHQCSPSTTPGQENGYAIFDRLALEQHMTVNTYYAARYNNAELSFFCYQQVLDLENHGMQADTAYVFSDAFSSFVATLDTKTNFCRYIQGFILCSLVPGRTGLDQPILDAIPLLKPGDVVNFSTENQSEPKIFGPGWSDQEPSQRWMDQPSATLNFRVQTSPSNDVRMRLSATVFVLPAHPNQRVDVLANGTLIAHVTLTEAKDLDLTIPRHLLGSGGLLQLRFVCPDAVSPISLRAFADARLLSIGIRRLLIEGAEKSGG